MKNLASEVDQSTVLVRTEALELETDTKSVEVPASTFLRSDEDFTSTIVPELEVKVSIEAVEHESAVELPNLLLGYKVREDVTEFEREIV